MATTDSPQWAQSIGLTANSKTTRIAASPATTDAYTATLPPSGGYRSGVYLQTTNTSNNLDWAESQDASNIDLYQYPATHSISGGGDALKTAIITNGGGTSMTSPRVYEIADSLVYNAGINLTNVNFVVIRGASGQRPTVQVDSVTNLTCFNITYTVATPGTTTGITIGNMDGNITGTNGVLSHAFFAAFRGSAGLTTNTIADIRIKDVFVYNTDYTTASINMAGVAINNEIASTARWATNVWIEDCRFRNIKSRTDRAAIYMMGVENYIGRRNSVSAPDITVASAHSSAPVRMHATSGKRVWLCRSANQHTSLLCDFCSNRDAT